MKGIHLAAVAAAIGVAVLAVAAAAGAGPKAHKATTISMVGIWTGPEEKSIQAVIDGFKAKNPSFDVKYTSGGDNTVTVVSTAVQGGNPPDVVAFGQPGAVKDFANRGSLKPITFAKSVISKNYAPVWLDLGTVKGKLYGLLFKGANKSTVWYSTKAFATAGVKAPKTWPEFLKVAKTLKASGIPAYSIPGADGWPHTDLFENIYLRQAGVAKYDQLTTHKIKWTDPTVKAALKTMAQVVGDTANIYGGKAGMLQIDFPTSVANVFSVPPKAAMEIEGDFVPGVAASSSKAQPIVDFNQFAFPSINGSPPAVVGGGDTVVMLKDSPAARAWISYLATPEAATIWAKRGGFSSPNKNVAASAYTDPLNRATALALAHAKIFRFDLSDLQPSAFGGTVGQGEFKIFPDFLRNPADVNGTAAALEAAAAKAYGK
jgi:ABC-type glycerol-3-phosphate transport system substrate-binding protein